MKCFSGEDGQSIISVLTNNIISSNTESYSVAQAPSLEGVQVTTLQEQTTEQSNVMSFEYATGDLLHGILAQVMCCLPTCVDYPVC